MAELRRIAPQRVNVVRHRTPLDPLVQSVANNATYFPTPNPPLASILTKIADLQTAQTATQTRTKGAAPQRDLKAKALNTDLRSLLGYVQGVIDANEAQGAAIAAASGFGQRQVGGRTKAALAASMGASPDLVVLRAKSVGKKRAAYEWQYSADGGKTWIALPVTTIADTTVQGLALGTSYAFRCRSTVGRVATDWCQVITFLVH
jgi:hypothetical protein